MQKCDFGSGRTDPLSFPSDALAQAAAAAIPEVGADLVLYPGDLGHAGLRRIMAERESEREGLEVSPDQIALMNGSMQAVTLVAEALMQAPGDIIITEELTYSGTIGAYKGLGAKLVGVPLDRDGMAVDALEETLEELHRRGTPPCFIYTLTTYQKPTGSVMPRERRLQLIEVAQRFETIVVEDNCYGDVHFEGDKQPALYALDPSPNQIYLGSLSKILGPGIRLGYLLARSPMLERILARRFDGGNSVLAAAICARYFEDNLWQHIERNNAILAQKRDADLDGLQRHLADICTWSEPVGGLFIWVGYPDDVDGRKLAELAAAKGLIYARGSAFHIDGDNIPYLRLAFGYPSLDEIDAGIPLLAQCLHAARPVGAH